MTETTIPTLYEWVGNAESFGTLINTFYDKAVADELLNPLFKDMPPQHRQHVADWFAEIFGGPKVYSAPYGAEEGAHHHMVSAHLNLGITEAQRKRWVQLMGDAADDVGLPADAEFRSAFMAYVEWGTRMALMFSKAGMKAPTSEPLPYWGWGEKLPYM
ncbi:MAG: group II truncated hemoglobin [Chloroflexota bacterium]